MVRVQLHPSVKKRFSKIKDTSIKEKLLKQLGKIKKNPTIGKPMRYDRRGSREIYISPYRLSYRYNKKERLVQIIALYHKDEQ